MERSDHSALDDGPKAFNGVGMDIPVNVLALAVVNHSVREILVEVLVAFVVVGRDQANLGRYRLPHEAIEGFGIGLVDHAGDHIALALDCAYNNGLSSSARTAEVPASARTFVLVLGFAADVGFVYLDISDQLAKFNAAKRRADLMAHQPRGFVGAETHVALDLQGAHAFLADQHQVNDAEPL